MRSNNRAIKKEKAAPFRERPFLDLLQVLATLATSATAAHKAFTLGAFASELARAANSFSLLASFFLRRLLEMIPALHLTEGTLPLHFLFQRAERLLHVIIAHNDLYDGSLSIN